MTWLSNFVKWYTTTAPKQSPFPSAGKGGADTDETVMGEPVPFGITDPVAREAFRST